MVHLPENHSGATSDAHLIDLWLSGRPESTQSVYRPVVDEFFGFVGKALQEVLVADLVRWMQALPGSEATRYRKVSTVKSLLTYAHRTGYTLFNVGLPIQCPRPLNRLHEKILEPQGVQEVIRKAGAGRDQILTRFLYATGARISEACKLRFTDIRGNRVSFFGKGRKTRTVLVPQSIADELQSLRRKGDTDHSPVFKSFTGKPLLPRNARQVIGKAADEAALTMSPHWLRHSHASHALDNGAPIHVVQQGLGHENVATTSRYLHARPTDGASRYLEIP
jgi:integrase/recombinase XerD